MAQSLHVKVTGLKTNPSPLSVKEGALKIAKNMNVNSPNTASSRRGFKRYGYPLSETGSGGFNDLYNYQDTILLHYGDTLYKDASGAGGWTSLVGTFDAPDSNIGIRAVENNNSFFFTTDSGLYKMDSINATPALAGIPKAIGMDLALFGASGFFTNDRQVAYRVVWGKTDANSVVSLGYPSERGEIANSAGGTRDVDVTVYIPAGITTDYFFQVYRSGFSADAATVANDELQLVYEANPTAGEISAGSVAFTDNAPDSLRGATIYTAPTQEGILQANELPPLANDVVMYKNYALFANTRTRHRKYITLLAVSGDDGIEIGDIVIIGGVEFTGAAAQDHSAGEFKVDTSGTAAENIANTAKSLVQVINRYSSNTITYAYYTSGYDELPGQILLERRDLTDSSFGITFNKNSTGDETGRMWNPQLSATPVTSDNENKPNRVYISKFKQPDAVPIKQHIDAGGEEGAIKRILALRDSVFILKDNGEIYRLVGESPAFFELILFDNTSKIIGPKTAVVFNNQIMCFTEQGVVAISDSGVAVRSWDIEDQLREFFTDTIFPTVAYGISYDSDRKYILFTGAQCFIYNSFTNSWTKWDTVYEIGFVNPTDDRLYWAKNNDGYVYQERKNYNKFDFADNAYDVTIVGTGSDNRVYLEDISDAVVGQTLRQSGLTSYISSIVLGSAYSTGRDDNLEDPDDSYNTSSNFIPAGYIIRASLYIGTYVWAVVGAAGTSSGWIKTDSGTTYGNIYFKAGTFGSPNWDGFAGSGEDGLKTFNLSKFADGDDFGGYFTYYYHSAAWTYAFSGNNSLAVISTGGDVYKDSVETDNLVVTADGETGPAGSATPDAGGGVVVEDTLTWDSAAATLNDHIDCEMEWTEIFCDNPGMMKRFSSLTAYFRSMNDRFTIKFKNNFNAISTTEVEITPVSLGTGWGGEDWDTGPWGGTGAGSTEQRTYFPPSLMRALWTNVRFETTRAFTDFSLNGLSIVFEPMDTEFTKEGTT